MYYKKKYSGIIDLTRIDEFTDGSSTVNIHSNITNAFNDAYVDFFNHITGNDSYASYDRVERCINLHGCKLRWLFYHSGNSSYISFNRFNVNEITQMDTSWNKSMGLSVSELTTMPYEFTFTIKGEPLYAYNMQFDILLNESVQINFSWSFAECLFIKDNSAIYCSTYNPDKNGLFKKNVNVGYNRTSSGNNYYYALRNPLEYYNYMNVAIDTMADSVLTRSDLSSLTTSLYHPYFVSPLITYSGSADGVYREGGTSNCIWSDDLTTVPLIPVYSSDGFLKIKNLYWINGQIGRDIFVKLNNDVYYIFPDGICMVKCVTMVED